MNKGTLEGTASEIDFVKYMNKNKKDALWDILKKDFEIFDNTDYYYIRVTKHVVSKLNHKKVLPKSDAYIIKGQISQEWLEENDYFIDETNYNPKKEQILIGSGTSIKRPDSNNFQIIKMMPDTFYALFGNYYLGATASLYCHVKELSKNDSVLKGWKSSWQELIQHLPTKFNLINYFTFSPEEQANICKNIKKFANDEIKNIILNNEKLSNVIFKGTYLYNEPYVAEYLFANHCLKKNYAFDFTVTTGSGRSKGDFTIVLKPKSSHGMLSML